MTTPKDYIFVQCEGMYGPCFAAGMKRSCRTQYSDELMNQDPILCESCAEEYNKYWEEMWSEYYRDRL